VRQRVVSEAAKARMALTPSERVLLIKEIGERLGGEDWPLIDVTLKQFSLRWSDEWRGDKVAYVLAMIEEGEDSALLDLGRHVGFQLPTVPPRVDPPFWRTGMLRLFLTHLATHRELAAELQGALWAYGISAFVAHNDIEPTQEWQTEIETALATCHALVALLYPQFHESNWTDQEIGFAMGRGVPVFSIRFGQDPYGFIGRFQAFNGRGKTASVIARELFEAYRANKQTEVAMADALVQLFEESDSFAGAKTRIGYLEELKVWKAGYSSRLGAAERNNLQIAEAWDVPSRIRALINKWKGKGV
jgi:hypothetical protein